MGAYVECSGDGYYDVFCDEAGCERWDATDFDDPEDADDAVDARNGHHAAFENAVAVGWV